MTHWTDHIKVPGQPDMGVDFLVNPRAKRFILRIDRKTHRPRVTVPPKAPKKQAKQFAQAHVDWIIQHLVPIETTVPALAYGQKIPWDGGHVTLTAPNQDEHQNQNRDQNRELGGVCVHGDIMLVPENRDLRQAVLGYCGIAARDDMAPRIARYVVALKALKPGGEWRVDKLRITDTKSRWGSCSTRRTISLTRRLMMAPSWIRDYVCAHEVAHLAEPNHSQNFWTLCQALEPGVDPRQARAYLKEYGPSYFQVGAQ